MNQAASRNRGRVKASAHPSPLERQPEDPRQRIEEEVAEKQCRDDERQGGDAVAGASSEDVRPLLQP